MSRSPGLESTCQASSSNDDLIQTNRVDNSAITRRPSFAARILQLIFTREPSTEESRPKSWSGCQEPANPVTKAPDTLNRHASTNIIIPSSSSTISRYSSTNEDDCTLENVDENCISSWRQRQTYCLNCGGLFFISQSLLSCTAGRFCSLDCKTTFQYVEHLQDVMNILGVSGGTSASMNSSSNEEYEVEEFDFDQL